MSERDVGCVKGRGYMVTWLQAYIVAFCVSSVCFARGEGTVLYEDDFEKAEVGKLPEDMQVIDGNFAVKADETNKFLELPGAPLDSFAVQFGPAETNSLSVTAVIRS